MTMQQTPTAATRRRFWSDDLTKYTHAEWTAEAKRLYGDDPKSWRFRCVGCGNVASVADWIAAGDTTGGRRAPYDCIGRAGTDADRRARSDRGECVWTASGLIVLDTCVEIEMADGSLVVAFPFADVEPVVETS